MTENYVKEFTQNIFSFLQKLQRGVPNFMTGVAKKIGRHQKIMRQTDFSKGNAKKKMSRSRLLSRLSVLENADISLQFKLARRASNRKLEYEKTCLRTRTIASNSFNLNCYSDQDAFHEFRFRVTEIPKISSCIGWHGNPTKRSRYRCDAITACCIVLRKLGTPCR